MLFEAAALEQGCEACVAAAQGAERLERIPAVAVGEQLGADGVFVGSGIFKSGNPAQRAAAVVKATTFFDDPDVIAKASRGLGEAMVGINVDEIPQPHRLAERGW